MDYFERVQIVLDYIEANLKEKLTLEDLAKLSFFSKFHFHRVFQAVVGEPLMEYIRKRRLSEAVLELKNPGTRITDIAYDYLFNCSDTFSRAFKRQYGINPEEYRKKRPQVTLFEKRNVMNKRGEEYSQSTCHPIIALRKNFKLVGLETYISRNEFLNLLDHNEDNREADQIAEKFFFDLKYKVSNQVNPDIEICYNYDCDDGYMSMVCVEVDKLEGISEEMVGKVIPDNKYAVFSHEFMLTPEQISIKELENNIFSYAYGRWFPYSDYDPTDAYTIELYDISRKSEGITKVDVYIPIVACRS
jgi:AraC family transcriptional regulator